LCLCPRAFLTGANAWKIARRKWRRNARYVPALLTWITFADVAVSQELVALVDDLMGEGQSIRQYFSR
jgi:hypothetical protein